jgi:predicted nucleic acid-binding protein
VQEPGTQAIDLIFDKASAGAMIIATSAWNLGEAFGVLDYRHRRRLLTERESRLVVQSLTSEVLRLMQTGAMQVYPVRTSLLAETWTVVLAHHLYQADALQIVTCNDSRSMILITGDEALRRVSESFGLKALDPDKQESEIRALFG